MKTVAGPDDYACMQEVLTRRFRHGLDERDKMQSEEDSIGEDFGSFTKFPDLLLMDAAAVRLILHCRFLQNLRFRFRYAGW